MHSLRKNHRFTICRTLVSERINAFPTHTLAYIPLGEPAKFQFYGRQPAAAHGVFYFANSSTISQMRSALSRVTIRRRFWPISALRSGSESRALISP